MNLVTKKQIAACIIFLFASLCAVAQTAAISGFCTQGGTQATVQGLKSSNDLQGIVPACFVTVYLTGTTHKATIYANGSGGPLSNSFTANTESATNPGGWIFWAATNQAYDVMGSGGTCPKCYSGPTPLAVGVYPSQQVISPAGQYLPLVAGATNPLTGTLYTPGVLDTGLAENNTSVYISAYAPGSGYTTAALSLSADTCTTDPTFALYVNNGAVQVTETSFGNCPTGAPTATITGDGSSASVTLSLATTNVSASVLGLLGRSAQIGGNDVAGTIGPAITSALLKRPVFVPDSSTNLNLFSQCSLTSVSPLIATTATALGIWPSCSRSAIDINLAAEGDVRFSLLDNYGVEIFGGNPLKGGGVDNVEFNPTPFDAPSTSYPKPMGENWLLTATGTLVLYGGGTGSGYAGAGSCSLVGGTLVAGSPDTCSTSLNGTNGVVVALSGTATYSVGPTVSVSGLSGGSGFFPPVLKINAATTVTGSTWFGPSGEYHISKAAVPNPNGESTTNDLLTVTPDEGLIIPNLGTSTSPICPDGTNGELTTSGCATGLGTTVYIMSAPYNAKCDGHTDDYAAIQAAYDSRDQFVIWPGNLSNGSGTARTCKLSHPITFPTSSDCQVIQYTIGNGTTLEETGTASAFYIATTSGNNSCANVRDLAVEMDESNTIGIDDEAAAKGDWLVFENVVIDGDATVNGVATTADTAIEIDDSTFYVPVSMNCGQVITNYDFFHEPVTLDDETSVSLRGDEFSDGLNLDAALVTMSQTTFEIPADQTCEICTTTTSGAAALMVNSSELTIDTGTTGLSVDSDTWGVITGEIGVVNLGSGIDVTGGASINGLLSVVEYPSLTAKTYGQINLTAGALFLPVGAPFSPEDSQCWTTTAGLFCQINGATVGPYLASGGAAIVSGTTALATSSISSGACQTVTAGSVNSSAATGAAVGNKIVWQPEVSLQTVSGYQVSTSGALSIDAYIPSGGGYVDFNVCNWTGSPHAPGALTLAWSVLL